MKLNKIHFDTIDSTNTYARSVSENADLPLLITAYYQTAGRGRHGKSFFSPVSGIYFSLLFEANNSFRLITPAAAVCVCESIKKLCGEDVKIKWVNDVFLDDKKICGILTERFKSGLRELTCVGIGINMNYDDFPDYLPGAGSLKTETDGIKIAESVCESILNINSCPDDKAIAEKYRSLLFIIGKQVTYTVDNIEHTGSVIDINDECNLIVRDENGNPVTLSSGEISVKVKMK